MTDLELRVWSDCLRNLRLSGGGDGAVATYIHNMLEKEKQLVYDQCEANANRRLLEASSLVVQLKKENEELKRALYFWTAIALERG